MMNSSDQKMNHRGLYEAKRNRFAARWTLEAIFGRAGRPTLANAPGDPTTNVHRSARPTVESDLQARPKAVTAVVFDLDGTLIDSNPAHAETWAEAFREHGVRTDASRIRRLVGQGGDRILRDVAGIEEGSRLGRAIASRKSQLFSERLASLEPTPGARRLLEHLRDTGVRRGVATSSNDSDMEALLTQAGLLDLFEDRASKDDAAASKPAPDIVSAVLARMRVPAASTLMVGDTPYDVEAASRAGVECIALRCGGKWSDDDFGGALAIFDHPAALLDVWRKGVRVPRQPERSTPPPAETDPLELTSRRGDTTAEEEAAAAVQRRRR